MDVLAHHTCSLSSGQHITCWRLGRCRLEARWQPPLQLLAVRIMADMGAPAPSEPEPASAHHDTGTTALLAWISCEKASSELPLDDPLQAELAMAIMTLKAESLHKAGFLDSRMAGGDNVAILHPADYSMK